MKRQKPFGNEPDKWGLLSKHTKHLTNGESSLNTLNTFSSCLIDIGDSWRYSKKEVLHVDKIYCPFLLIVCDESESVLTRYLFVAMLSNKKETSHISVFISRDANWLFKSGEWRKFTMMRLFTIIWLLALSISLRLLTDI